MATFHTFDEALTDPKGCVELYLDGGEWHPEVKTLPNLKALFFEGGETPAPEYFALPVEKVSFRRTKLDLKVIAKALKAMPKLKGVDFDFETVKQFPKFLLEMPHLEELELFSKISGLPEGFEKFTRLRRFIGNGFKPKPEGLAVLCELKTLEDLELQDAFLKDAPKELFTLPRLKRLSLSRCPELTAQHFQPLQGHPSLAWVGIDAKAKLQREVSALLGLA